MKNNQKDLRIEIRFKNNNLYKKIFNRFDSINAFCKEFNLNPSSVGKYLNLKENPTSKSKRRFTEFISGYYIKKTAIDIANALNCNVFDIFPSQLWDVISKVYSIEVCSKDQLSFNDLKLIEDIDVGLDDFFDIDNIPKVLNLLTPTEENVLRMRFGIDQKEKNLDGIANVFNLSRERVRQIEAKALRKLRHPTMSRQLLKKGQNR